MKLIKPSYKIITPINGEEEWRDVIGFEGEYEVSNFGRVKSLARLVGGRCNSKRPIPEKILIGGTTKGYRTVTLQQASHSVHNLVATMFLDNPNNYPMINHKDSNKQNNNANNLEWIDHIGNQKHASINNLTCKGERNKASTLKEKDILAIRVDIANGMSCTDVAESRNLATSTVCRIKNKTSWSHI